VQRDGAKAGLGRSRIRPDIPGDRRRTSVGDTGARQNRETAGRSKAYRRLRRLGTARDYQRHQQGKQWQPHTPGSEAPL